MFKKTQVSVLIALLCASSVVEAGRIGGGRSSGMSRSSSSYSAPSKSSSGYATPARPVSPAPRPTNPTPAYSQQQAQPVQKSGPGWGTVAAGAAAGAVAGYALNSAINSPSTPAAAPSAPAGVAAPANAPTNMVQNPLEGSHPVMPATAAPAAVAPANGNGSSFLWILLLLGLLGGGLFFLRRKNGGGFAPQGMPPRTPQTAGHAPTLFSGQNQAPQPMAPNEGNGLFASLNPNTQNSANTWQENDRLPNGSTVADFLRQARATFQRVQTMNSAMQINEIRNYLTADLFEELKRDITDNRDIAEFPELHTQLLDATDEGTRYIASVRFSGRCSEATGQPALPFSETWHFVQTKNEVHWKLAGIQQD